MHAPKRKSPPSLWLLSLVLLTVALIGFALVLSAREVAAETAVQLPPAAGPLAMPLAQEGTASPDDAACQTCHQQTDAALVFPSGETLEVQVDPAEVASSAHGILPDEPLKCTACHAAADYQFPHPPPEAETLREFEILRAQTCDRCHQQPHITSHPGLDSDNPVICTDCHGSHDVLTAEAWEEGQGVDACAACHTEAGVDFVEPARLTEVIQNGLFAEQPDNDYCLSCHSLPGLSLTLDSGEVLDLTINEEFFHDSVHGLDNPWQPLECRDCHEGYLFPHEPVVAETLREYSLQKYPVCAECHQEKYQNALDGVHGQALQEGNENAPVCTDCHGSHYVPPPDEPRSRVSYTCGECHATIFEEYQTSVHGAALLDEGNQDVPVCTDCHGVHFIADPNLAAFRNSSPELCGQCHADQDLMEKYGISTEVFDTYVADFHGTTVTLFELQDPDAETNKAVCYDCHGVHDIKRPDDPDAGIKANLLETCRKCHPDANASFPDAWTSHYEPSLEHYPLVFLVNWFYRLVIPGTLVFLGFLVTTDIYRRVRERFGR